MKPAIEFKSLQPGFVVVQYDPEHAKATDVKVSDAQWKEAQKRGFFGGVILPYDVTIQSLCDEELAELGLARIPRTYKFPKSRFPKDCK